MHRFIALRYIDGYFELSTEDIYQLKKVLRVKSGDYIICLYNNEYHEVEIEILQNDIKFKSVKKLTINNELNIQVRIIMSLIRSHRWDYFLQKATELGASEIIPYAADNGIIKITPNEYKKKIERWSKICKEAAEQSYRNKIPIVHNIVDDYNQLETYKSELNLVCHEKSDIRMNNLSSLLSRDITSISIFIGPEGGFTDQEIKYFTNKLNCEIISLGKRILRAETAPLMLLSNIIYERELKQGEQYEIIKYKDNS